MAFLVVKAHRSNVINCRLSPGGMIKQGASIFKQRMKECMSQVTLLFRIDTILLLFFFFKFLFIYFWLCWVFVAARGLSLVVESGGYSS